MKKKKKIEKMIAVGSFQISSKITIKKSMY